MTEIMKNNESRSLTRLDMLTQEMNGYMQAISYNLMQVARVLKEAREITERGHWAVWVRDFGFTERKAELYIQTYERFADNAAVAGVQRSNLFKMLSLPAGEEKEFMQEHDVTTMSAREVDKAVKDWNERHAPERDKTAREWGLEKAPEMTAEQIEKVDPGFLRHQVAESPEAAEYRAIIDQQKSELERKREEIQQMISQHEDAMQALKAASARNAELQKQLAGSEEDIDALQEALDNANNALANAQSAHARQEASEGLEDKLTVAAFAAAVRQFIGACVQLPQMKRQFAAMPVEERKEYSLWLSTLDKWICDAEIAIATCDGEGSVV